MEQSVPKRRHIKFRRCRITQKKEYSIQNKAKVWSLELKIAIFLLTPPTKVEQTECSETSAHKIQTMQNHPNERIQHSEQGESVKSRTKNRFV